MGESKKTVLLTGASGFLGSHMCNWLIAKGYKVKVLVRPTSSGLQRLKDQPVEVVEGAVENRDQVALAMQGVALCIHCAARVGDDDNYEASYRTNVIGTQNILNVAHETQGDVHVIYLSSLGIYEFGDHYLTTEQERLMTQGFDAYTETKRQADEIARSFLDRMPLTILRPGFIYGPGDTTVMPKLIRSLRKRIVVYFESDNKFLDQIYVGNLTYAIGLAMEASESRGQIYNLTDDPPARKSEFFKLVAEAMGVTPPTLTLPGTIGRVLLQVSKLTGRLGMPFLSQAAYKFLGKDLHYSIAHAKNHLKYHPPHSFQEGIEITVRWFQQQKEQRP